MTDNRGPGGQIRNPKNGVRSGVSHSRVSLSQTRYQSAHVQSGSNLYWLGQTPIDDEFGPGSASDSWSPVTTCKYLWQRDLDTESVGLDRLIWDVERTGGENHCQF